MKQIINYLIESGISITLLSLVYLVFLRRETLFSSNRFFLLFSVLFSLVLPMLNFPVFSLRPVMLSEVTVTPYKNLLEAVVVTSHGFTGKVEEAVISSELILAVYAAGVLLMSIIFGSALVRIFRICRSGTIISKSGYQLVLTRQETAPFSFLNFVILPGNYQEIEGYQRILDHELEHIRQRHTYDLLLLEILLIFQWFNPFIWLLRRIVRENHEFQADRAVLNSGVRATEYKILLLSQVTGRQVLAGSHFNYSLLKKRIQMITRIKSNKMAGIKMVAGVLIAAALIILFACEQKKSNVATNKATDSLSIRYKDDAVQISGNAAEMQKILEMLKSRSYDIAETSGPEQDKISLLLRKSGNPDINKDLAEEAINATSPKDDRVFVQVETMPEFPGGAAALMKYIGGAVKYPDEAIKNKIEGKVIVTFVVTKDGTVRDAKIARGVSPVLDAEAVRVVNSLPKWIPGKQRGENVDVAYTIPISFRLQ
jgi:TonB family protein